jgi:hypothetical protein
MRKVWLLLMLILPSACAPVNPYQSRVTPPPSSSPMPSYQPWSRHVAAEAKLPKEATSSGVLQISEQLAPGPSSFWEYTYTFSGEAVVVAGGTRIGLRFTQLGELSSDRLPGAGLTLIFYKPIGLAVDVAAPNDKTLEIDWNRVTLIGPSGDTHRVIHKGQRFSERDRMTPPSIVPPGSRLSDFVFPSDLVAYEARSWRLGHFFERVPPGSSFALFLPIKTGDAEVQHHIVFTVSNSR